MYNTEDIKNFFTECCIVLNIANKAIISGINETKQCELELLVSCLHNLSAKL